MVHSHRLGVCYTLNHVPKLVQKVAKHGAKGLSSHT